MLCRVHFVFLTLAACGTSSSTDDGGTDGASDVAIATDVASESAADVAVDSFTCPTTVPANLDAPSVASCTSLLYVAGGDNTTLIVSTDGVAWTSFQVHDIQGDDYINDISIADGVVTITSLPGVYQSTDGAKTFDLVANIAHNGFDTYGGQVNAGPKGLLLTDNEGTYVASAYTTWVRQSPFAGDASADGFGGHFHGRAVSDAGHYVAFQDNGRFREWDGTSFVDGTTSVAVDAFAFGNGVFLGIGSGGAVTSTDGITWKVQPGFDGGAQPNVLVFDGAKFLAYNFYSSSMWTSTDGIAWTTTSLGTARVGAAAFYQGHYFAAGNSGATSALLLSTDGITWTSAHTNTATETFTINGPRVALGRILH